MNNKGQVMIVGFMMAITIVILALAFAPVLKDFTNNARNDTTWDGTSGLNCSTSLVNITDSNPNVTFDNIDGTTTTMPVPKIACVVVDSFNWYFIGFLLIMGVAYLAAKVIIE